ncbi:MAG: prenyltransferase/squalene oxidase repeat-containing protein, partial [Planctomycetaceae bacterium]
MSHLVLLTALLFGADEAAAPEVTVDAVHAAADKGITYMIGESRKWVEQKKCASCHHVPFTIWTLNEAKYRGHAIDEAALTEMIEYTLAADDRAKLTQKPPPAKEGDTSRNHVAYYVSVGSVLSLLALADRNDLSEAHEKRRGEFFAQLIEKQADGGGKWEFFKNRPPLAGITTDLTLLTLLTLSRSEGSKTSPPVTEMLNKALPQADGLIADEDSQQYHNFRLLLDVQLGDKPDEIQKRLDLILSRQEEVGGWSQTTEMDSDAYATGQTLYTLAIAGVPSEHPAIQKAWAYLLKTQKTEGFWPMTSRPHEPGGVSANNLDPITSAGSGWAVLGLLRSS